MLLGSKEACLTFSTECALQAAKLERLKALRGHELYLATDDVVRTVMSQPRLEPAVAFGPVPQIPPSLPPRPRRALLLGVQDPNNLGSLLRSGLAMGIDTVFLLPNTPDPFNTAVLRASAGAAMGLRYGDESAAETSKLPVVAAVAHGGSESVLHKINPDRFILALGHETRGLPPSWLDRGALATLPLSFESLGVAVAGAILLDRISRDNLVD